MLDRRKNYSKYVTQVHVPIVSTKKQMELKSLISLQRHPVKNCNRVSPGTQVDRGFFSKRGSRSAGYVRNPKAYPEGLLPSIDMNIDVNESQGGNGTEFVQNQHMNMKGLYKSASYQNSRKSYVSEKRKIDNKNKGNLDHLEKYNDDIIIERRPKVSKPPVKDYLGLIRAQRIDRESKQTSQEKINLVMQNKKLNPLEKL